MNGARCGKRLGNIRSEYNHNRLAIGEVLGVLTPHATAEIVLGAHLNIWLRLTGGLLHIAVARFEVQR